MNMLDGPIYIDIFAGCGGISLGLHNSGWKGLFAIEKSDMAFETLSYNLIKKKDHFEWPEWLPQKNYDINYFIKKYSEELKDLQGRVDLVVGGPPCQGFSMAGRRDKSDKRNKLINSYVKFISLVKPKMLLFENVKGFTIGFNKENKKGNPYSDYVIKQLRNLGYNVEGKIVDFSDYGVPQKRHRFILVGILDSSSNDFFENLNKSRFDFLASKNLPVDAKTTLGDAISDLLKSNGTLPSPDSKGFVNGKYKKPKSMYQKIMRDSLSLNFPDSHRFANHRDETILKFETILKKSRKNHSVEEHIKKKFNMKKHCIIPLDKNSCSPTLTTLPDDYIHYKEPRILTVREYARIQSFPDWYEFRNKYTSGGKRRKIEVPRYSQIGNAIPPFFGEISGLVLLDMINKIKEKTNNSVSFEKGSELEVSV
jgi:DNA (cytosine-5)-methyltransferase 1